MDITLKHPLTALKSNLYMYIASMADSFFPRLFGYGCETSARFWHSLYLDDRAALLKLEAEYWRNNPHSAPDEKSGKQFIVGSEQKIYYEFCQIIHQHQLDSYDAIEEEIHAAITWIVSYANSIHWNNSYQIMTIIQNVNNLKMTWRWKPIETAPRDGTIIFTTSNQYSNECRTVFWEIGMWCIGKHFAGPQNHSHWMDINDHPGQDEFFKKMMTVEL